MNVSELICDYEAWANNISVSINLYTDTRNKKQSHHVNLEVAEDNVYEHEF